MIGATTSRRRWSPGRFILALAPVAPTACRFGASDRAPNASALGADSSRLLKSKPTAAVAGGAAKATDPGAIALSGQGMSPGAWSRWGTG